MTQLAGDEDVERYVQECTLFFLHKQYGNVPVKRQEVVREILNDASRKTVNEVLKQTKHRLKEVHFIIYNESYQSYFFVTDIITLRFTDLT